MAVTDYNKLSEYVSAVVEFSGKHYEGFRKIVDVIELIKNHQTSVSKKEYEDQQRINIDHKMVSTVVGSSIIEDAASDRKLLALASTAISIVATSRERWFKQRHTIPSQFVHDTVALFGMEQSYDTPLDPNESKQEKFWLLDADGERSQLNMMQKVDDLPTKTMVFFDGIDFSLSGRGPSDLNSAKNRMNTIGRVFANDVAVYHYPGAKSTLGFDFGSTLRNRDHIGSSHKVAAQSIVKLLEKPEILSQVRYSNGVFFGKAVDNAVVRKLSAEGMSVDDIGSHLNKLRVFTAGIQPLWGENHDETLKLTDRIPEIGVYSVDDLFAPTSEYSRGISYDLILQKSEEPFKVFSHPEQPNKISIFLGPNLVHKHVNLMIDSKEIPMANVGGHQIHHYMASLGMLPDHSALNEKLTALGNVVQQFMSGELGLSKNNLVEVIEQAGVSVEPLIKSDYRGKYDPANLPIEQQSLFQDADIKMVENIAQQLVGEMQAMGRDHPLLKTANAIDRFR